MCKISHVATRVSSQIEEPANACRHSLHEIARQRADQFVQVGFIDRCNLRGVGDRIPAQPCSAPRQQGIARRPRHSRITRKYANYHRIDEARVDLVTLQDENGVTVPGLRTAGLREIHPPDLAALDQPRFVIACRRAALLRRRTAAEAGSSPGWPCSAMTLFHKMVGSDGPPCLARYSRAASVNSRLRETFRRFEKRSTSSKRSSGIEMAVFMNVSITGYTGAGQSRRSE